MLGEFQKKHFQEIILKVHTYPLSARRFSRRRKTKGIGNVNFFLERVNGFEGG